MEMRKYLLCLLFFALLIGKGGNVQAQNKTAVDKADIEYESQLDDPYDIHKMWLHIYPFYADAFVTSFNVGFGAQINYLWKNKFDFRLHGRTTYAPFSDFSRLNGELNTITTNKLTGYRYIELGATYHFKDEAVSGESKIMIQSKNYEDRKWTAAVPEYIKIPTKVRKIMSVRAGGYYWGGTTNLGEALQKQGRNLINSTGDTLDNPRLYTNIQSAGVYVGGQLMRIRNVVVKPNKYNVSTNDLIFSAYADILYAPFVKTEDIFVDYPETPVHEEDFHSTSPLKTRKLGFRLGIEGMYNREFSWSYGAEIGFRPSIQTRGFYANVRVGFAFASKMQQKRQAYQVESKTK